MTRQLACMGPRVGLQTGRTDTQPRSEPFERGETKPLFVSRPAVTGECRDPDGGAQTIPNQAAACTRTETQPAAWVPLANTGDFPEDVSKHDCMGEPTVARWLGTVGKLC